ncbi:MAG: helix-turn-helix domain-containing protein [Eubacteriales bacterium]|nr:helix-turn-helix domain-containing protein [Eubacteriales bacterium]
MHLFLTRQPSMEVLPDFKLALVERKSPILGRVSMFFQFSCHNFQEIHLVPDGSYDLLFFFTEKKVSAWLYGSVREVQTMPFEKDSSCFGIRFYPGSCSHLFPLKLEEFSGRIPFFLKDREEEVFEKMAHASFEERIQFMNTSFFAELEGGKTEPVISYCTGRILETSGMVTIKELMQETGYSDTWIRNRMLANVGFKPKEFAEIIRFQNSLHMMTEGSITFSRIAQESGFFDQSQMNRTFKKFAHTKPSALIGELHRIYKNIEA